MGMFSVGGLATGLDTQSIIGQLMKVESRPRQQLEWKQQLWTARKGAWSDLNSRLLTLQNLAKTLLDPVTWDPTAVPPPAGGWSATSADPSRFSASVIGTPTAGSHAIEVTQLARGEISTSTGTLPPATSGVRSTGQWFEGAGNVVEGNETFSALRNASNQNMNFNAGSKVTMNYTVDGVAQSAVYTVANLTTNNLADFTAWVETTIGNGATATWNNGALEVTTAPGTANELDALSFSAVNAANAALTRFNPSPSAASSTTTAASDGGVAGPETLTITQGASTWNVALVAGDQLQDIANRINATTGIGVIASISGGALRLQSTATGAAKAFDVTSSGPTAAALGFAETQSAQDAIFSVDGTIGTSATNSGITSAIPGLSLSLTQVTTGPVQLDVVDGGGGGGGGTNGAWVDATVKKIQDFVAQYNAVLEFVNQKTAVEQRVINPKTLADYVQGPMARDVQFSGVAFDLRRHTMESVQGLAAGSSMLADLGISTTFAIGGGGANGKLTVDEAKLKAALVADPAAAQAVLAQNGGAGISADDGIIRRISELVTQLRTGGRVEASLNGASNQVRNLQSSIDRANDRLERRQEYYDKMFASLETRIGRIQSQNGWLSGQFASMSSQFMSPQ